MKILSTKANAKRRCFEVRTRRRVYYFPYAKADPAPTSADPVINVAVDDELGNEGITYDLSSGRQGSIHVERVLDYNGDPSYLRNLLLYQLSVEAQKRVAKSQLSKREIARRLGTSATQLYRLLDQSNTTKSIDHLLRLLSVLDCQVEVVVRAKCA